MVVAARTGDSQAQQPASDRVDAVVDLVVQVVVEPPAQRQEAHRRQPPGLVLAAVTSAASCSWMNRSKPRSRLNARIT